MLAIKRRHLLILLAVCSLAMATRAVAEDVYTRWTNPSLGDWFIASNWDNGVPVPIFGIAAIGRGTVLINGGPENADVGRLDLSAGKVILSNTFGAAVLSAYYSITVGGSANEVGELDITNDAFVSANNDDIFADLVIGNGPYATGVVRVQDGGTLSVHTLSMGVTVSGSGLPAAGFLTVENGAYAQSGGAFFGPEGSQILGVHGATSGSVTVTGGGSLWNFINGLTIGLFGAGSLLAANGGTVHGVGLTEIGAYGSGSSGTVTVTGSGSLWQHDGNVLLGGSPGGNTGYGSGELHVRAGGLVRAHHLKFFTNGALDIDNGSHAVARSPARAGTWGSTSAPTA
jgi:T5SS/PEP-CTERM-associated repeat protein